MLSRSTFFFFTVGRYQYETNRLGRWLTGPFLFCSCLSFVWHSVGSQCVSFSLPPTPKLILRRRDKVSYLGLEKGTKKRVAQSCPSDLSLNTYFLVVLHLQGALSARKVTLYAPLLRAGRATEVQHCAPNYLCAWYLYSLYILYLTLNSLGCTPSLSTPRALVHRIS